MQNRGELWENALVGDLILPAQFYNSSLPMTAERRLMFAVLEDGIRTALMQWSTNSRQHIATSRRVAMAEEALDWINDRGGRGIFAFETLCLSLGVDAQSIREAVGNAVHLPRKRCNYHHQAQRIGSESRAGAF